MTAVLAEKKPAKIPMSYVLGKEHTGSDWWYSALGELLGEDSNTHTRNPSSEWNY